MGVYGNYTNEEALLEQVVLQEMGFSKEDLQDPKTIEKILKGSKLFKSVEAFIIILLAILTIVISVFTLFIGTLPMALLFAAIMIWVLDVCVNIAQGPYRALVPDLIPQEQHSLANSYLSFAIGLGSVIAAGTAPCLKYIFNYQMSINAQFVMAALAFSLAMLWTCITIKEQRYEKAQAKIEEKKEE